MVGDNQDQRRDGREEGSVSRQVREAAFIVWVVIASEMARVWETSECHGDLVCICLL